MPSYNVTLELEARLTPRRADELLDVLQDLHPAIAPTSDGRRMEVVLTLGDETIGLAVLRAIQRVQDRYAVAVITAMTTEEFDQRTDAIDPGGMVDTRTAAELLGVTRQRIQQLHASGQLPGRKIGNSLAWPQEIIQAYAASRATQD